MFKVEHGDLFDVQPGDIIVNTVNTIGVMGAGVAKEFKRRMPEVFNAYSDHLRKLNMSPGDIIVTGTRYNDCNIIALSVATKKHFKDHSKIEWVEQCIANMKDYMQIAAPKDSRLRMPPLGCGNGGLDVNVVTGLIKDAFIDTPFDVSLVLR